MLHDFPAKANYREYAVAFKALFNVNAVGTLNIVSVTTRKQYENKAVLTIIRWYRSDAIYILVDRDH